MEFLFIDECVHAFFVLKFIQLFSLLQFKYPSKSHAFLNGKINGSIIIEIRLRSLRTLPINIISKCWPNCLMILFMFSFFKLRLTE